MTGRIFLIASLILTSALVFAQSPEQRIGFGRDEISLKDRFGKSRIEVNQEKQNLFLHQSNKKKTTKYASSNIYGKISLDSVVIENKFKADYTYNREGDITKCIRSYWDDYYRCLVPGSKCELKYDTDRREIQYSTFWWHKETSEWIEDQRQENNYNILGELTKRITYYQLNYTDYSSELVADYIDEYTYDTNGKLILDVFYMRERATGQMVNNSKTEYFYDLNGNPIQTISYDKNQDTGQWEAYWKIEYNYDEFGNKSTTIIYSLNKTSNNFMIKYKYESTYNAEGKQTHFIYSEWDDATGLIISSYKIENSYDASWKIKQIIWYNLNDTTNQYVYTNKVEYTYDTNGNNTLETEFKWDRSSETWDNNSKSEYLYDSHGNPTLEKSYVLDEASGQLRADKEYNYTYDFSLATSELILPPVAISGRFGSGYFNNIHGEVIVNKLVEYQGYEWNETNKELAIVSKVKYYYSDPNNSSILDLENVKLYPNPVYDNLVIHYNDIPGQVNFELFDIQGKKILSSTVSNGEALNVQNLSSGVYIYNITYANYMQRGKLLKINR